MAISLFHLACSPKLKQVFIEASCDDFMKLHPECAISKKVQVAVDGLLILTLCSNPTTGFQWELTRITDQTVLEKIDNKYMAPEVLNIDGAPGKEVWTFKALKKGKSFISMEYSRPWEGGEKAERTFFLSVVVE